ncbi:MAG: ABC transporter ATP-binding protein [Nocardioides sp.]|uniref:ABC transporter ATP-binding protein n=1 Tax=Nocardioides sp. TaxID=35761 RepID=UPI0039E2FA3F
MTVQQQEAAVRVVMAASLQKIFELESERVTAVAGVDLTVVAGEFVCLFGASGSGKSTLLNLVAGLEVASGGELAVCGLDLVHASDQERANLRLSRVGVVFQDHNLLDEFTALENVMLPLEVAGWSTRAAVAEAMSQLEKVGLGGLEDRYPRQMSGGQRQRVGIARALVGDRSLLLADEPTGSLDSANSLALFELLRALSERGQAVLLATHEERAIRYADRCFVMTDGAIEPISSLDLR